MSEYPWNETNITFTWLSYLYNPFKEKFLRTIQGSVSMDQEHKKHGHAYAKTDWQRKKYRKGLYILQTYS